MSRILVVAPHPDDETLGCGGTLLRHAAQGDEIHWVVVTGMTPEAGYPVERIAARDEEIKAVAAAYGFSGVHRLGFAAATLDAVPRSELIGRLSAVMNAVRPEMVYGPHGGDAHSDHGAVAEAVAACTKIFRYPFVRTVLGYETISETDHALAGEIFRPNRWIDITPYAERKVEIMTLFADEWAPPPFPRSPEAIRAQMVLRGSQAGCLAAEAFMVLKDIQPLERGR